MTPYLQRFGHDPEAGVFGDCTRAAYASILDLPLDAVPHFHHDGCDNHEAMRRLEEFLNGRGLHRLVLADKWTPTQALEFMGRLNPEQYWVMGCGGGGGVDHSVVCCGGSVVSDPSGRPVEREFESCASGFTYIEIPVPLSTTARPTPYSGEHGPRGL